MKKLWYAACAAAFCLMLSSCAPNVGKITYSGGFDAPTVFSLSEEAAARVGKDYPIYKPVFPREADPEEYDKKLLRVFGVSHPEGEKVERGMKYTCDDGASLTIYDTGHYRYDFSEKLTMENVQTDEEALTMVQDFLRKWDMELPDTFRVEIRDAGIPLEPDNKESAKRAVKSIQFYQPTIDGYRVTCDKDVLGAYVQQDGIKYFYGDRIDYAIDRTMPGLSLEEVEKLKPRWVGGTCRSPESSEEEGKKPCSYASDTPVIFTDVEICLNRSHTSALYQPVYVFKGTRRDEDGNEHPYEWEVPALEMHYRFHL